MARSNWSLEKRSKNVLGASVGWYGVPGKQGGNTHVVTQDGHNLCGHRPSSKHQFQNCGALTPTFQPECSRCLHMLQAIKAGERRDRKRNMESNGFKVEPRTWASKPLALEVCHGFDALGPMLEKMFVDGNIVEVRIRIR